MPVEQPKRKLGFFGVLLVLIALVGISAGMAHFMGKLDPILDFGRQTLAKLKNRIPKEQSSEKIASQDLDHPVAPTAPPAKEVSQPQVHQRVATTPSIPQRVDPLVATYKARFKAPRVGSKLTLIQKSGSKLSGILEAIAPGSVQIKKGNVSLTLQKSQLTPRSVARCYENAYVAYMIALHKKQTTEEMAMRDQIAKFRAEYESQRGDLSSRRATLGEKTNKSRNTTRGSGAPASTSKTSSHSDMDFKKWMDEHGQSDLLKARKKRIAAYEAQRIREGREY